MHTNHTGGGGPAFHDATTAQLAGVHVVCFVAFAVLGTAAAVFPAIHLFKHISFPPSLVRFSLAVAMLALGWLVAGLSGFMWERGSVARVVLNAFAWYFTLVQWPDFYQVSSIVYKGCYDGIVLIALLVLAVAVVGTEAGKFVALLLIVPVAVVVVLACTVFASQQMSLLTTTPSIANLTPHFCPGGGPAIGIKHVVAAGFTLLGLYTLICEVLSAEYSGAVSLTVEYALMLVSHLSMLVFWLCFAFGVRYEEREAATGMNGTPLLSADAAAGVEDSVLGVGALQSTPSTIARPNTL